MKNQNKTQKTNLSPAKYLNAIKDPERRRDCKAIAKLMQTLSKKKPKMWGASIVGFDEYHYKYPSGREGDWMKIGFSNRKDSISLYLTCDLDALAPLLEKLGTYKRGVGCLYIKKLEDIHIGVLTRLIREALKQNPHQSSA
ncbi:DUF1801 domain-containing protein [Candidatus Kaiserbacteria bacterium]|nr:MAG: DUF1801 domain-containing protein [Candidatus Kaiserbacteria bacterium]